MAATTIDTLLVRIEADMSGLRRDLKRVEAQTRNSTDKVNSSLKRMEGGFRGVGDTIKRLGPLIATGFAGLAVKSFIRTGAEVENLQVRMKFLFGSAEEGAKAFQVMADYAGRVPFSLGEIQQAGGILASVSKDSNELAEILKITGNVAAVSGLSFTEAAGNLQRAFAAGANSADLFRERGVLALAGFQAGAETTVADTVRIFREKFGSGGEFGETTDAMATTFDGTMSMLGDSLHQFRVAVADAGLLDAFKDLADMLRSNADGAQRIAQVLGKVLTGAVKGVTRVIELAIKHSEALLVALGAIAGVAVIQGILMLASGFIALTRAITAARVAGTLFNTIMSKGPLKSLAALAAVLAYEMGALDEILLKVKLKLHEYFPATKDAEDGTKALVKEVEKLSAASKGANKEADALKKSVESQTEKFNEARLALAGYSQARIDALKASGQLKDVKFSGNVIVEPIGDATTEANKTALEGLIIATDEANEKLAERTEKIDNAKSIVEGLVTEEEALRKSIEDVKYAMENGAITTEQGNAAISDLQTKLAETDPFFASFKQGLEEVGSSIAENLADAVVTGKLSLKSLLASFQDFVKKMIADAIKMFIIKRILGGIFGGGGGLGSLFGGGGGGNITATGGSGFAGGGAVRGFAGGGSAPMLVGERGPELFVPHSAGSIKNNMDTKNILGSAGQGVVVNQTINVDAGVAQTVRAEILSMLPAIKQDTLQAVVDARRRGGSFASAFGG